MVLQFRVSLCITAQTLSCATSRAYPQPRVARAPFRKLSRSGQSPSVCNITSLSVTQMLKQIKLTIVPKKSDISSLQVSHACSNKERPCKRADVCAVTASPRTQPAIHTSSYSPAGSQQRGLLLPLTPAILRTRTSPEQTRIRGTPPNFLHLKNSVYLSGRKTRFGIEPLESAFFKTPHGHSASPFTSQWSFPLTSLTLRTPEQLKPRTGIQMFPMDETARVEWYGASLLRTNQWRLSEC
ncbi:hypothetical protein Anapl_06028 [Anas platyrhynchos]|uniref:Uncharacterized protein n=1 Tax=Anas platyrhynchos TaxID=8839 RepID=R0LFC8_ANAPL|nr:hypothetical protein Anapl_06028 [Anas platyrhynchos]